MIGIVSSLDIIISASDHLKMENLRYSSLNFKIFRSFFIEYEALEEFFNQILFQILANVENEVLKNRSTRKAVSYAALKCLDELIVNIRVCHTALFYWRLPKNRN